MASNQRALLEYGHWNVNEDFNSVDYYGFVYLIINKLTGRKYIGKKNFIVDGAAARYWKVYTGSQKELNNDIALCGKENFIFKITHLCDTSEALSETEYSEQVNNNVLSSLLPDGTKEFYNRYIHSVKFDNTGNKHTDVSKEKIKKSLIGRNSGKLSTKADTKIYKFKHTTGREFSGTQWEFKKQFSILAGSVSELLHSRIQTTNGWYLVDKDGNRLVMHNDNKGENCYRYDKDTYTIINCITGEVFSGNRKDILHKLSSSKSAVDRLINGSSKSVFKWIKVTQ